MDVSCVVRTVHDVVVPVARGARQLVLAVLVGREVEGVRRARARHHGAHASHRPEEHRTLDKSQLKWQWAGQPPVPVHC